jgi:protein SCO1/2
VRAGAALLVTGCGGQKATPGDSVTSLRGLVPQPLPPKPSFTLTDTAGRPFSFAARTRGKLTYLYFGYTHCPDACPATMDEIAYALKRQPASVRRHVEVVFVTVDPRRDTRPVLRAWLNHFNTSFVGLTGSEQQIEAAEGAAGIPFIPGQVTTHSSMVLPYSPGGLAHVVYTQGFKPDDYAHDLPLLLRY